MINFNGTLFENNNVPIPFDNRAFSYGDSVFDTLKYSNGIIHFAEEHYFRLMASMRMLRMEIPTNFTLDFYKNEIVKTIEKNEYTSAKVKVQIFRKKGGLYTPSINQINFVITTSDLITQKESTNYIVDIFKDYYVTSDMLGTVKSTNKITHVLASIYAKENNLSNCILVNEKKQVVEATNGNIFIVKDNVVYTPSLKSGCLNGIIRKQVIQQIAKMTEFKVEEKDISPFELLKADAIFITNSIIEIQGVTKYRKKEFDLSIVNQIKENINLV